MSNGDIGPKTLEHRMDSFSRKLYLDTIEMLAANNSNALDYLLKHPKASCVQLAKKLGDSASAFGLIIAIYEHARRTRSERFVAKELLYREIINAFPEGWHKAGEISPAVELVFWITAFESNVQQQTEIESANRIYSDLVRDNQPAEGWKPLSAEDPYLIQLFDRHWPLTC